jgi:hypothetical protein
VRLQSGVLAATEALVGMAYDANDTNLYRLEFVGHIEFLDIEKESVSANLAQPVRDLLDSEEPPSDLSLSSGNLR